MIDTLNFTLSNQHYDYKHIEHIFNNHMQFKVDSKYVNGSALVFNYKNYCFKLTPNCLVAQGSLAKLYNGNNVQNLSFPQIQAALMEFETIFGIPFDKAVISRIDIAASIIVEQTPKLYIDILQVPSGFEPNIRRTTKTFTHHAKVICIYDKVEQLRKAKHERTSYNTFKGYNILKYELRYDRYLLNILSGGTATFNCLYSAEFYKGLVDKWYQQYQEIPKLTIPFASQLDHTSLTKFKNSLIKIGINSVGGIEVLLSSLKHIKMPKFVRMAIKRYLESLPALAPLSPILQQEMDSKFDEIYCSESVCLNAT